MCILVYLNSLFANYVTASVARIGGDACVTHAGHKFLVKGRKGSPDALDLSLYLFYILLLRVCTKVGFQVTDGKPVLF